MFYSIPFQKPRFQSNTFVVFKRFVHQRTLKIQIKVKNKDKGSKWAFHSNAIEEPLLIPAGLKEN